MAFEKYSLRGFIKAWFEDDFSIIPQEEFTEVKSEYIDTAGMYDEDYFQKVAYIHFIGNRVNSINISIKLQKDYLEEFGKPYIPGFLFLKKFGHRLSWLDKEDFYKQLDRVESKEKRYTSELENCINNLNKIKQKTPEEVPIKERRHNFIRTINSLGKQGYKIDIDHTTVEEFALMIKAQKEELERLESKNTFKK